MRTTVWALLLLATGAPLAAWGPTGHRIVGRIAEGYLSEEAAAAAEALLAPDSLARASYWPDEARSDPAWQHADAWHWISIEDGETYETSEKNPAGDVVEAIRRMEAILRNREAPQAERAIALKFLVHFVGDVHQPLHVGRRADQGGNDGRVTWHGQPSNLHSVWDSAMIDSTRLSFSEYAEFIDHPSAEEIAAWQASTLLDWVAESKAVRARVYEIGDGNLGYAYSFHNLPVVERRLVQAGVRLAGLLNSILAPPAPEPPPAPPDYPPQ